MKIKLTAIIDIAIPEGATDSKPRQLLALADSVIIRAHKEGQFTTLHAATVRSIEFDSHELTGNDLSDQEKFTMACERLEDMLKDDDGQAFKEARKFLDLHAPKKLKESWRYMSMEEIIETLKPSQAVMRDWLAGRNCFMGKDGDCIEAAKLHMPDCYTQERIAHLIAEERAKDNPECEKCGSKANMVKHADGWVCHSTHPTEMSPARFPAFATVEGADGHLTALARSGPGTYYREAGAWELECKHDEEGVLRACPSHKHLKHLIGRVLTECTQEFHDTDNGLNKEH